MITAAEFVKEYMASGCDVARTAEQLDVNEGYIRSKVSYYRKRGVKLPLPKGSNGNTLDVNALNQLVKSYK